MPDKIIPITQLDQNGVILDVPPVSLPHNVFTNARNVRFKDGAVRKMEGEVNIFPGMTDFFVHDDMGEIKYLAWWPNPNQASRDRGYYILIMEANDGTELVHYAYSLLPAAKTDDYDSWTNISPYTDSEVATFTIETDGDQAVVTQEITNRLKTDSDFLSSSLSENYYIIADTSGRIDATSSLFIGDGVINGPGSGFLADTYRIEKRTYRGFTRQGSWQHTLFNGGFSLIINNGLQKPQYITDPSGNEDVKQLSLNDLPGWDSYEVNELILNDTFDEDVSSRVFDTGQLRVIGVSNFIVERIRAGETTVLVEDTEAMDSEMFDSDKYKVTIENGQNTITFGTAALIDDDEINVRFQSDSPVGVRAAIVRSFGEFLVAGNLIEYVLDSDGEIIEDQIVRRLTGVVRSSNVAQPGAIPNGWNPFAAGVSTADEFVIADTGTVQDMVPLQGNMYLYTNSSISAMRLTGNPNIPLTVQPVTDQYGALVSDGVLEFDGKHFVIGSDDIYLFGGHPGSIQSVSDTKVRRDFFNTVNPINENIDNLFTLRYAARDEIWICFPSVNSTRGECDLAYIWNYRTGAWTIRDLTSVINGDIGPVPGGGVPSAILTFTGTTGSNGYSRIPSYEVQTMEVDPLATVGHAANAQPEEQTYSVLNTYTDENNAIQTRPQISANTPPIIDFNIDEDFYAGPDLTAVTWNIPFPAGQFTYDSDDLDDGGARFTGSVTDEDSDGNNINGPLFTITAHDLFEAKPEVTAVGTSSQTNVNMLDGLDVSVTEVTAAVESVDGNDSGSGHAGGIAFDGVSATDTTFNISNTNAASNITITPDIRTYEDTKSFTESGSASENNIITPEADDPDTSSPEAPLVNVEVSDDYEYTTVDTTPFNVVGTGTTNNIGGISELDVLVTSNHTYPVDTAYGATGTGTTNNVAGVNGVTVMIDSSYSYGATLHSPSPGQQHRYNGAIGRVAMDNTGTQAFTDLMGGVLLTHMNEHFRLQMRDAFCEDNPKGGGLIVGPGGGGQPDHISCGRAFPPREPSSDVTVNGVRTITWTNAGFDPRGGGNYTMVMSSANGLVYIQIQHGGDTRFNIGNGITVVQNSTGRRARVTNNSSHPINITAGGLTNGGNFATGNLAVGASTEYVTADSTSEAWSLNFNQNVTHTGRRLRITNDTDTDIVLTGGSWGAHTLSANGGFQEFTRNSTDESWQAIGSHVFTKIDNVGRRLTISNNSDTDVILNSGTWGSTTLMPGASLNEFRDNTNQNWVVSGTYNEQITVNQTKFTNVSGSTISNFTTPETSNTFTLNAGDTENIDGSGQTVWTGTVDGVTLSNTNTTTSSITFTHDTPNATIAIPLKTTTTVTNGNSVTVRVTSGEWSYTGTRYRNGVVNQTSIGYNPVTTTVNTDGTVTFTNNTSTSGLYNNAFTIYNFNGGGSGLGGDDGVNLTPGGFITRTTTLTSWVGEDIRNNTQSTNVHLNNNSHTDLLSVNFDATGPSGTRTPAAAYSNVDMAIGDTLNFSWSGNQASAVMWDVFAVINDSDNQRENGEPITYLDFVTEAAKYINNTGDLLSNWTASSSGSTLVLQSDVPGRRRLVSTQVTETGVNGPTHTITPITTNQGIGSINGRQPIDYRFTMPHITAGQPPYVDVNIDIPAQSTNNVDAENRIYDGLIADPNFNKYFEIVKLDSNNDPLADQTSTDFFEIRISGRAIQGDMYHPRGDTNAPQEVYPDHGVVSFGAEHLSFTFGDTSGINILQTPADADSNSPVHVTVQTGIVQFDDEVRSENPQNSQTFIITGNYGRGDSDGAHRRLNENFRQMVNLDPPYSGHWSIIDGDVENPPIVTIQGDVDGPRFNKVTSAVYETEDLTPYFDNFNQTQLGILHDADAIYPLVTIASPEGLSQTIELNPTYKEGGDDDTKLDNNDIAYIIRNQFDESTFPNWIVQKTTDSEEEWGTGVGGNRIKFVHTRDSEFSTQWRVTDINYGTTGVTFSNPDEENRDSDFGFLDSDHFTNQYSHTEKGTGNNRDFRGQNGLKAQPSRIMMRISNTDFESGIQYIPITLGGEITYDPDTHLGINDAPLTAAQAASRVESAIIENNRRVDTSLVDNRLTLLPVNYSSIANFVLGFIDNFSTDSETGVPEWNRIIDSEMTDAELIKFFGGNTADEARRNGRIDVARSWNGTGIHSNAQQPVLGTRDTQADVDPDRVPRRDTDIAAIATMTVASQIDTEFDPLRPWPTTQVNLNKEYPLLPKSEIDPVTGFLTQDLRGGDIGFLFDTETYTSYVERIELGLTPEFNTETVLSLAIHADGGTRSRFDSEIQQATLTVQSYGNDNPGENKNEFDTAKSTLNNDFNIGKDYKLDMRTHGRFINYRISDEKNEVIVDSQTKQKFGKAWNLSGLQAEIGVKGSR